VLLGPSAADRLAEAERRAAQLAERNRLARELHDSVGHALSVVAVQSAAAVRVLDRDPEFARTALGAIGQTARAALTDLDYVLGVLREDPAAVTPQRTLADLDRLLDATRLAGVAVSAERAADLDAVPAAVSREAYRIVQEGLTNALRHAGQVPVRVALTLAGERLTLSVSNPLRHAGQVPVRVALTLAGERLTLSVSNPLPATAPVSGSGGGRGLTGIAERVTLLGGEVTAGPDDGQWRLTVTLPVAPIPDPRRTP
ncbi:MAG: sensor histidine kinase, partial [Micromonosporaceae bacterium]